MGKKKKHKKFFKEDTPHGIVKRVMYKKYLQAYIAKTQNEQFNLKTIIIDGFAGAGRYSEDWPEEIEKYGSPLIAQKVAFDFLLEKAKRLAKKTGRNTDTHHCDATSWISAVNLSDEELEEEAKSCRQHGFDNNTDITMIFIEADKTNYRNLVNNIELMLMKFVKFLRICHYKYSENSEEGIHSTTFSMNITPYSFAIKVHNRKFETFNPPAELKANCTRSLTFLDPFGFSHTPMAHVKKFAPGEGNEIFINFMSQYVNRNITNTPKYICDLYGIDVADETDLDTMIECIKNSLNSETEGGPFNDKITRCADMYTSYLKGQTITSFSQAFEVKGQGNLIIYHLIHTTNHIRGIEAMKEAMNRCSQKPGEMAMSDYDIVRKGHILNFGNLDDPDVVADLVFEKFKGKENVLLEPSAQESNKKLKLSRQSGREVFDRFPTVKEFVLLDTKFLYRKNAIATLQSQGKITKVVKINEPQKRQYCFPDKNSKTKIPKKWYVSFAKEAPESDYTFKKRHELKEKEQEKKKKHKEVKRLQREEEKRLKRDKEETEKEKKRKEKEEKRQQREKEKTEKEKKRQEREEKREKVKAEKEKKKNKKLEMKKQKEKKRREEEQKQQKSEAERQKMSKQMKNYLTITKVPSTKSHPKPYTGVPIDAEMEPMTAEETSMVAETELMAPAETSAPRVDETKQMAPAQTSASNQESSQEVHTCMKESNKRKKEKQERSRKKKRCETRSLSEVHDEIDCKTETERCISENVPDDHGL